MMNRIYSKFVLLSNWKEETFWSRIFVIIHPVFVFTKWKYLTEVELKAKCILILKFYTNK